MPETLSLERTGKLLTELSPERGPVHEVSRFADGSVTGAYRLEVAEDGACALTGLVDPQNMHAGDPLMDLVRLDAFSMFGDETKIAGLLSGYGVREPGRRSGEWPESWLARIRLYRIVLCVELYNWFTIIGRADYASDQDRVLRELVRGGV